MRIPNATSSISTGARADGTAGGQMLAPGGTKSHRRDALPSARRSQSAACTGSCCNETGAADAAAGATPAGTAAAPAPGAGGRALLRCTNGRSTMVVAAAPSKVCILRLRAEMRRGPLSGVSEPMLTPRCRPGSFYGSGVDGSASRRRQASPTEGCGSR